MREDEEIKEVIVHAFEQIVRNEFIKTESLKQLALNLTVAKIEIESGVEVELNLGLLEFVK